MNNEYSFPNEQDIDDYLNNEQIDGYEKNITSINENLIKLNRMKRLELDCNNIQNIPNWIQKTNLTYLSLTENKIETIPDELYLLS